MLRIPRRTFLRGGAALAATKLFAPSIIKPADAAFVLGKAGGGGGGGYVAKAVHFDGATSLTVNSFNAANSPYLSWSVWFKILAAQDGSAGVLFVTDPDGGYTSTGNLAQTLSLGYVFSAMGNSAGSQYYVTCSPVGVSLDDAWHSALFSGNCQAGESRLYIDDVDVGHVTESNTFATMVYNGLKFIIGDDGFGTSLIGDFCDLWIAPGVSLLDGGGDIPEATRRLFIDASGKPVNPSGFPASAILFSGDDTTFADNQGTGGTYILTGTLTNATTSPSD